MGITYSIRSDKYNVYLDLGKDFWHSFSSEETSIDNICRAILKATMYETFAKGDITKSDEWIYLTYVYGLIKDFVNSFPDAKIYSENDNDDHLVYAKWIENSSNKHYISDIMNALQHKEKIYFEISSRFTDWYKNV